MDTPEVSGQLRSAPAAPKLKGGLRGEWQGGHCQGPTGLRPARLAWEEKASRLKDTSSKHTSTPARAAAAPLHTLWPLKKAGQPLAACPPPPRHPQGTGAWCPQTIPASFSCCLRAGLLKIVYLLWLKDNATHRSTASSADTSSGMRHLCSDDNSHLDRNVQVGPAQGAHLPLQKAPMAPGELCPEDPQPGLLRTPARGLQGCLRGPTRRSQDCVRTAASHIFPFFPQT